MQIHYTDYNEITTVSNTFAFKLLNKLYDEEEGGSIVFSPYSINFIMSMLYRGMDGNTKKEFEKIYKLNELIQLPYQLSYIFVDYDLFQKCKSNGELHTANMINIEASYKDNIKDKFISLLNYKRFEFSLRDFKVSPDKSRKDINDWVSNQTKSNINNLLPPNSITNETKMVLVNTIYLNMKWYYEFVKLMTNDFKTISNELIKIDYMTHKNPVQIPYYEDDDVKIVSIPYKNPNNKGTNGFSLKILLPTDQNHFELFDVNNYLKHKLFMKNIQVILPKFTIETSLELKQTFEKMGFQTLFNDSCNLGKMNIVDDIKVDEIYHKAKIEINEQGTEASGATAVVMKTKSAIKHRKNDFILFNANRTFQYAIVNDITKSILFSGVFNGTT